MRHVRLEHSASSLRAAAARAEDAGMTNARRTRHARSRRAGIVAAELHEALEALRADDRRLELAAVADPGRVVAATRAPARRMHRESRA